MSRPYPPGPEGPRPLPRGRGLLQPVLESGLGDPRVITRQQGAPARGDAEVARPRIGDDLAGIAELLQGDAHELVEAELLGARDLDDAVQGRSEGHPADLARDV